MSHYVKSFYIKIMHKHLQQYVWSPWTSVIKITPKIFWFSFLNIGFFPDFGLLWTAPPPFQFGFLLLYDSASHNYSVMNHKKMLFDTENWQSTVLSG